ncbi:MAG: putative ABC transporter permease subunit [Limisphaerales bacterium]
MNPASSRGVSPPLVLLLRTNLLQAWRRVRSLREQSRLLSSLIGLFVAGYLWLAFLLFHHGLKFVATFPGLGTLLTERLLFLLFAFLFVLLLFSNLVICYTNLFRNRETIFLLALPVPAQTIFRWKFMESALLASWAFIFLIAPLLAAYGLTYGVPWHFYPVTVVLVALFIVLPAVGGAWFAVNLARYLDRRSFQVVAVTVAVLLLVGAAFWLKPEPISDEMLETRVLAVLDRLLMKTRFANCPFLPSYWLSASVLNWSEGALQAAVFFILVLLSHVLFFGSLCFTRMGNLFYDAASVVQSRGSVFSRWEWFRRWRGRARAFAYTRGGIEVLVGYLRWIRPDVRALLVKDMRMFWRDTTQWGQTLVLFGLLGVYIINLRHFSQQLTNPFWTNLISYLNLCACALNLATLTTRFVYPQFSLEGRRLWIVGLAPLGLVRVVKAKFGLASCASLILTLGLVWLSCHMLKMPLGRTLYFAGAIAVMTFSLNGLAVGLGALYPNLKEENPSKMVSGFGGTFCLVLSFLYILGSVALLAIGSPWGRNEAVPFLWTAASWSGFAGLSLALGWVPLKLGLRQVADFEL